MRTTCICFLLLIGLGCQSQKESNSNPGYPRWIGDITFDPELDKADFEICGGEENVKQYFNFTQGLQYDGEKRAILNFFQANYSPIESDNSGLVRIRFLVNCKGETDRFRIISMNDNYEETAFDADITDQLLNLIRQLNGWKIMPTSEEPEDYYQYLIFKIQDGKLIEILP